MDKRKALKDWTTNERVSCQENRKKKEDVCVREREKRIEHFADMKTRARSKFLFAEVSRSLSLSLSLSHTHTHTLSLSYSFSLSHSLIWVQSWMPILGNCFIIKPHSHCRTNTLEECERVGKAAHILFIHVYVWVRSLHCSNKLYISLHILCYLPIT